MAGNNPDGNYFDYFSSRFVDHFNSFQERLNGSENPRPLDKEQYVEDEDTDQSNTCSKLAVEFYNQQLRCTKDSHKFTSGGLAHYHVNFKAAEIGEKEGYTFFTEVTGDQNTEIPATVTMVTLFATKEERKTRNNCSYCTGLRHPRGGGFVGHQPQEESDEEDDDEEDSE